MSVDCSVVQYKVGEPRRALLVVLVFLLIYNISFKFAEFASTGRIAILLLLIYVWHVSPPEIPRFRWYIYLIFVPIPYVFVQFIISKDFGQLSRFLHLALYSFLGAWCVARLAGERWNYLLIVFYAIAIQAFIIIFSFASTEYRSWHLSYVVSSGNFDAEYIYRAPGLSGPSGSSLSVVQAMGVLCGWLLLKSDELRRLSGFQKALILFGMALITISCVVVGRTGLMLSIVFVLLTILNFSIGKIINLIVILAALVSYLLMSIDLDAVLPDNFSIDFFSNWAFGFLSGEDQILNILYEMGVPRLTLDTFFGTGLIGLIDGANPSGNDSGFIQAYYSMGLLVSVIFYASYLYVLIKMSRWLHGFVRLLVVFIFFMLEIKEPFLFKYVTMFVLVSLYYFHLIEKDRRIDLVGP